MTRRRMGPVFALLERSLRVDSRSWPWAGARAALPLIVLFALIPTQTMFRYGAVGAPGLMFFSSMVWTTFALLTLAGLSFFAAAIAEEKEEMTLGLLRMTDLSPASILFGKSTGRLASALLLLAISLPFTLLAVTLGGISTAQVLATYATLAAYLFFLANMALLWSVVSPRPPHAAALTGITLVFLYAVPSMLAAVLPNWRPTPAVAWREPLGAAAQGVVRALPTTELSSILRTGFSGPAVGVSVPAMLGAGAVFFGLSWLVFDRCTREQRETAPARGVLFRRGSRRSRVPSGVCGSEALAWKDFTFMGGGLAGLLLRLLLSAGVAGAVASLPRMFGERTPAGFVSACFIFVPLGVVCLGLVLDAGRMFNQEWQGQTLSGLAALPFPVRELIWRKVQASLKQVLPVLLLLLVSLVLTPDKWGEFLSALTTSSGFFRGLPPVFLMMVVQYALFVSLTAFLSLVLKRGAFAAAVAILYFGMGFLMMPLGMLMSAVGVQSSVSIYVLMLLPASGAIVLLWFGISRRIERLAAQE